MKEFKITALLGMLFLAINGGWIHLAIVYTFGALMFDDAFWVIKIIKDVFKTGD